MRVAKLTHRHGERGSCPRGRLVRVPIDGPAAWDRLLGELAAALVAEFAAITEGGVEWAAQVQVELFDDGTPSNPEAASSIIEAEGRFGGAL